MYKLFIHTQQLTFWLKQRTMLGELNTLWSRVIRSMRSQPFGHGLQQSTMFTYKNDMHRWTIFSMSTLLRECYYSYFKISRKNFSLLGWPRSSRCKLLEEEKCRPTRGKKILVKTFTFKIVVH